MLLDMKRYRLILKEDTQKVYRRMLLTSTGFDNRKFARITMKILSAKKPLFNCNVMFIPTADRKRESIKACIKELNDLGIPKYKIFYTDCCIQGVVLKPSQYDMIYVTGGDENYLIDRINEDTKFRNILLNMINRGVYYVGVSAGSYICGNMVDRPNQSLGLFNYIIEPHQNDEHNKRGSIPKDSKIVNISDNQALMVMGNRVSVIE